MSKLRYAFIGVGCLTLTSFAAVAQAQQPYPRMAMNMAMIVMDENRDGVISEEEYMKHYSKMWTAMDRNGDGVLDAQEQRLGAIPIHKTIR